MSENRNGAGHPAAHRTAGRFAGILSALVMALVAGCATEKTEEVKLVWPAPPLPARIKFERSLISEKDVTNAGSSVEEDVTEFLTGKKPPENRIMEPMGIAVSADGQRVYVSDFVQLAVYKFDFANKKFTKFAPNEQLARPAGIALDAKENVYVVESDKQRVKVFSPDGKELRTIGDESIERPTGVAIDQQRGRVYVADTSHSKKVDHTVKIFDMNGKLIGHIGHGKGPATGQFMFPTYVAVDQKTGNVYVSDTLNSRVQEFDPDGKFIQAFGERGNSWGMFDKPKGVALDSFGNLYVVDSGWSNVQMFNQKKDVLMFFGGRGGLPGMLRTPNAIAIDKNNNIYIGDYLNHRVEVYQLVNTSAADSFLDPLGKGGKTSTGQPAKN